MDDLRALGGELFERVLSLAHDDAEFRARLHRWAEALLEHTRPRERSPVPDGDAAPTADPLGLGPTDDEPLPELTLGRAAPHEYFAPPAPRASESTDADLGLVESRCRLKAEGLRWAATRRRRLAEGAHYATEIEPLDRDIIARAKQLPDCYLWMCHSSGPSPSDLGRYEIAARSFENVADALAILRLVLEESALPQALLEQGMDLLAEAQSALRGAIAELDGPADHDQVQAFAWLKAAASRFQVYVGRHMRLNDPADPSRGAELSARLDAFDEAVQSTRSRTKRRRRLLGKVRHKASLICNPDDDEDAWRILIATVEELLADGLPPSHRELRETLAPVMESLPDGEDLPDGFRLVLREMDRYLANRPPSEPTVRAPLSAEVERARSLLAGRDLVLIGGQRRPGSWQALKDALGLGELIWIETREHESIAGFEPYVARENVAVVLLAIRWASHSYGEVRTFCDLYGKPLVRLPGGYHPNQVAAQILAQCSERLQADSNRGS